MQRMVLSLTLAAAIGVVASSANAGIWEDFKKSIKEVGEKAKKVVAKVTKGVREAGKAFLKEAGKVINAAKKLPKAAAKEALHWPFYGYIAANRRSFCGRAKPMTAKEKKFLAAFFPKRLIDKARVLVRSGDTGYFNKSAGATTFGTDCIIVRKGHRSNSLLKHEMVHVCQYDKLGVKGFAFEYANQYVDGGFKYKNIKFEKEAYRFQREGKGPISAFLGYCK